MANPNCMLFPLLFSTVIAQNVLRKDATITRTGQAAQPLNGPAVLVPAIVQVAVPMSAVQQQQVQAQPPRANVAAIEAALDKVLDGINAQAAPVPVTKAAPKPARTAALANPTKVVSVQTAAAALELQMKRDLYGVNAMQTAAAAPKITAAAVPMLQFPAGSTFVSNATNIPPSLDKMNNVPAILAQPVIVSAANNVSKQITAEPSTMSGHDMTQMKSNAFHATAASTSAILIALGMILLA